MSCFSCQNEEQFSLCQQKEIKCNENQNSCKTTIRLQKFGANKVKSMMSKGCEQTTACSIAVEQNLHQCPDVCIFCCSESLCETRDYCPKTTRECRKINRQFIPTRPTQISTPTTSPTTTKSICDIFFSLSNFSVAFKSQIFIAGKTTTVVKSYTKPVKMKMLQSKELEFYDSQTTLKCRRIDDLSNLNLSEVIEITFLCKGSMNNSVMIQSDSEKMFNETSFSNKSRIYCRTIPINNITTQNSSMELIASKCDHMELIKCKFLPKKPQTIIPRKIEEGNLVIAISLASTSTVIITIVMLLAAWNQWKRRKRNKRRVSPEN